MASKTFRLFKLLPCFLLGVASVLDLGSTIHIYNEDKSSEIADYKALESDWEVTGADLYQALTLYGEGLRK